MTSEHLLSTRSYQTGINYNLDTFKTLLAQFGHPHLTLPKVIHVAGTNGKGSVVAYLESALHCLGYTVGSYTSPHLVSYRERFKLNLTPIPQDQFDTLYHTVQSAQTATEFELLTLMAFLYFSEKTPDYLILETGLGGRLDATNVITPILSIITKIGLDHQAILGHTLPEIATEKAGIIKPNIPIITGPQHPDALAILTQTAHTLNAPLITAPPVPHIPDHYTLQGDFQKQNLGIAITALTHLLGPTAPKNAQQGLATAQNWGRYTHYRLNDTHTLILDAGHNADGITATLNSLALHLTTTALNIIVGFKRQKNAKEMLDILTQTIKQTQNPRSQAMGQDASDVRFIGGCRLPRRREQSEAGVVKPPENRADEVYCPRAIYYCEFDKVWAIPYPEAQSISNIPLPPIPLNSLVHTVFKHRPSHPTITLITGSIYFLGLLKPHLDHLKTEGYSEIP